jgi:hypothetical protein
MVFEADCVLAWVHGTAGGSWGDGVIRVRKVELDLLQVRENKGHEEERHVMGKQVGERGGRGLTGNAEFDRR